jgi:hypothetical protein
MTASALTCMLAIVQLAAPQHPQLTSNPASTCNYRPTRRRRARASASCNVCSPVLIKFRCNPRTASFVHFTLPARGQECSPAARQRGHCHSLQPPASLGDHLAVTCNTDARVRPPTCPPIRPPMPPQMPPPVCKTLSVAPAAHQETGSTGYTKSTAWETAFRLHHPCVAHLNVYNAAARHPCSATCR